MQQFSRKGFIQTLTLGGGSLLTSGLIEQAHAAEAKDVNPVTLKNDIFSLTLKPDGNTLMTHLVHVPSNTVLADGPYSYTFGPMKFSLTHEDVSSATVTGTTDAGLELTHIFRLPAGKNWLEEEIAIKNATAQLVSATFRCGFVLPVDAATTFPNFFFSAIPFRREPRDGSHSYQDFSLDDILTRKRRFSLISPGENPVQVHEDYASEGWVATDGKSGFVFSKYNDQSRDQAILDHVAAPGGKAGLRWGGAGWSLTFPEGGCVIPAGALHSFGTSRITAFDGGLNEGCYAFRTEMESRGHGCPQNYNPPVHWNELYDNKLWWTQDPGGQDNPDNRRKYYTRDLILQEAAKAKAIGCEALYCDPGWDTNFASKIWDESRMGKMTDFVATLRNDYGLKLSLHTPLSGWCNSSTYPPECFHMDRAGHRLGGLCGASKQYVEESTKRFHKLAADGATYFMFDGTQYSPEACWDPSHGHALPATHSDHVDATNLLARRVHEKYPDVSIEMHDPIMGPGSWHYVPHYYGHGKDGTGASTAMGYDTIWAYEMMWDPMGNLVSGQSMCLYYYNLTYSIPLYLHIDLRTDNDQAVVFWWNASTIRYLGIGGTHADPKVNDAHLAAMRDYKRLKPYFTAGTFYGLSEAVHVHKHPTANSAVMNVFVFPGGAPPAIAFDPAKFGLDPAREYKFSTGDFKKSGTVYSPTNLVTLTPGHNSSHTLVEITEA